MCSADCVTFAARALSSRDVRGKRVIELGSRNVNGSLRPLVLSKQPSEYIGVDIERGPGVDRVCSVCDVASKFGKESFDLAIATELLEHVRDWRSAVSNMKAILKPGGILLITTRSRGFPYHGFPNDFWRYGPEDMEKIFSDFDILALEKDPANPGVFLKAKKSNRAEADISGHRLYSIIAGSRISELDDSYLRAPRFYLLVLRSMLRLRRGTRRPQSALSQSAALSPRR